MMRDKINAPDSEELLKEKDGIKIYYKGILTAVTEFKEDANLIEYMDIKDTLSREYLKLSRKGFSQKGYAYLEKVYHEIVKTARIALEMFDTEINSNEKVGVKLDENTSIGRIYIRIDKLSKEIEKSKEDKERVEKLEELENLCLSSTALIYFAMINEKSEVYSNERITDKGGLWKALLEEVYEKIEKIKETKKSVLYNIPVYEKEKENVKLDNISIVEVIQRENNYMVSFYYQTRMAQSL